jgi:copper oxidase (laccase) domain-containing protein
VAGRILPAVIARMVATGTDPADLLVALGPAVSGARYPVERWVSLEVAASLRPEPRDPQMALSELIEAGALAADAEPGRDQLDIRAAIRQQLAHAGVDPDRCSSCPLCTVEEETLFHSWRRDQVKAVQWSGIVSQG